MAYVRKTWVDRQSQTPTQRKLTNVNDLTDVKYVTVERDEGTVSVQGDVFDATTMNNLEDRIANGFLAAEETQVGTTDPTSATGKDGDFYIKTETVGNVTSVVGLFSRISGDWYEVGSSGGAVVILGTTAPTSAQGENGNLYVQYHVSGNDSIVDALFVKISGAWCQISTGGGSTGTTLTGTLEAGETYVIFSDASITVNSKFNVSVEFISHFPTTASASAGSLTLGWDSSIQNDMIVEVEVVS